MSRTYVPRVAVTDSRAIVSMHNKRRARRSPRVDGLSKALAGAVEMLEQRWLLAGEGLQGTYFEAPNNLGYDKNAVLYSTPVGNRVDPKIDFITPGAGADRDPFGGGAFNNAFTGANLRLQGTGLADDQFFDVRWEGTLTVPGTIGAAAENFTFFTRKDDGVRLWVNGTKILDHWNDTGAVQAAPGDVSTPILLTPGTTVPILLEYTQGNGAAGVGLYWQSDSIVGPRTDGSGLPDFVPQANLNKAVTKPAAPTGLSAPPAGVGPFQAELDWSDNANNEAFYRIEKSTDGGAHWTTAISVPPLATATGAYSYVVGGLAPNTTYQFRVIAENFANIGTEDPTTTVGPVTLTTAPNPVNAPGLIGQYFSTPAGSNYNRDVVSSGTPVGLRIDPAIDFLDPAGGVGTEQGPFNGAFNGNNVTNNRIGGTGLYGDQNFTARWEGQLHVTTADTYTFFTRSDDGIRLAVNGTLLIDHWNDNRGVPALPGDTSVGVTLAPGDYPIVIEFNQGGGGAGAGLYWSTATVAEQIIPSANLRTTVVLPTAADTLVASNPQGSTVDLSFNDNSNNEARFRIEASTDGGTTWTTARNLGPQSGGAITLTVNGLLLSTNYKFRVVTYNEAGTAAIPASAVSNTINTGIPNTRGAFAQYVNNKTQNANGEPNFGDPVVISTIVPGPIDFAYGTGSPDPAIQGDDFSTRFSGIVHIVTGGSYTFRINTDDGGHLWVNGQLVSDYPGLHGAGNAAVNTPITLPAGDIPFVFVQAERGGGADAHMFYTGPDTGGGEVIVPGAVNPTDPGLRATGTVPTAPTTPTGTAFPSQITVNWSDVSLNEYGERLEVSADNGVTWTTAQRFDVIANPGGAPTAESVPVTGLIPNHSYKFRVVASNYIGDGISNVLTISTLNVPPGFLTITPTTPISGDTNLTNEGNLDWLHIGYPNSPTTTHQKINVVGPRITVPTALGGGVFTTYNTTGKTFTWTDAQPVVTANDVTKPGDPLVAIPGTPNDSPAGEGVVNAIDNNSATKYLSFTKLNTGFIVTPSMGSTLIGGITITSANDAPERDPASYQIFGSNDGGATFTAQPIAQGNIPLYTARFQKQTFIFTTPVTQAFTTYKVIIPTVANATAANSMQLSDVELLQANPQENATATANASSVTGNGKGFHLTVPAGPTKRRIHLYVGVDGGGSGVLTATLADGSVAPMTATLTDSPAGPKFAMYELDFASGLTNQTIGLDWVENGAGSVILSGASWIEYLAPAAPTGVATVATGKGRANVSWTDNANNETGYRIERAPDVAGAPGTFATVTTTAPNITQFVDSGLTEGTKYWYRVSGVNLAGATVQSGAPVSVTTRIISTATNAVGLKARFWNDEAATTHNTDNLNSPVKVRVDYNDAINNKVAIAQNWGNGSPDPAVNVDNFSSQWDGKYIADYTGPTTFFTDTDDGGRFFLDLNQNGVFDANVPAAGTTTPNGELIVNSWVDQGLGIDGVNNGRGIVVNLVAGQEYQMRFQQFEHGGGAAAFLYVQTPFAAGAFVPPESFETPIDLTPPKVTSVEFDRMLPATATYTPAQHLAVHFSEPVGGSANAVTITQLLDGGQIGSVYTGIDVVWNFDSGSNTGIITLPGGGELPDGNYQLKLTASGINDNDGNPLDGNGDGTGGDDFTYNFYILKGDTQAAYNGNFNGDRKISFIEYQRLELNYGKTASDRISAAEGDFNHDGVIDDTDVKWFFDHNGNTLAPPAPSSPVGAPAPAPVPVTTTKKVTKPAPKPVAKPVTKPVLVTVPPKTTFGNKKIAGVKDLLSGH